MYVEDELFLGKIVKESLETRGFEVVMEDDGAKVLSLFNKETPDICILDVMLPNRSGFEIAADIRKENDDVPVIFLTAKVQTEDVVQGFKLGANDYIRKPFSMEELIVRIENALRVRKDINDVQQDVITLGKKYQYNVNRQVLLIGTEERKLSYRESELLKYLWSNKEKVIDRRDILNLL